MSNKLAEIMIAANPISDRLTSRRWIGPHTLAQPIGDYRIEVHCTQPALADALLNDVLRVSIEALENKKAVQS